MMTEAARIAVRMRDVGLALFASRHFGQSLNRLRLQKFVYLLDQIGQLLLLLPPSKTHYSFKRGPFDPNIQNAVDALAFRGLVKIVALRKDADNGIHTEYSLTQPGELWLERMQIIPGMAERRMATELLASEIDRLGWARLRELVYAEPTYLDAKPRGFGEQLRQLEFTRPSSASLFQAISHALSTGFEREPSIELIVELYFDFLSQYSITESKYAL